jgi:hypothetical protein
MRKLAARAKFCLPALAALASVLLLRNLIGAYLVANLAHLQFLGILPGTDRGEKLIENATMLNPGSVRLEKELSTTRLRNGDNDDGQQERMKLLKPFFDEAGSSKYLDRIAATETRQWLNLLGLHALLDGSLSLSNAQHALIMTNLQAPGDVLLFPHGDINLRHNIRAVHGLTTAGIWSQQTADRMVSIWQWRCADILSARTFGTRCDRLAQFDNGQYVQEHVVQGVRATLAAGPDQSISAEAVRLESLYWTSESVSARPYIEIVRPVKMQHGKRYKLRLRYTTHSFTAGNPLVALIDYTPSQRHVFAYKELPPSDGVWTTIELSGEAPSDPSIQLSLILRNHGNGSLIYDGILLEPVP